MKNKYLSLRVRILWLLVKRRKISVRKILNAAHCYAAYFLKLRKSAKSPYLINFELWNECNESCLFCRDKDDKIFDVNPNGKGEPIPKGKLDFNIYKDIIAQTKDYLLMSIPYVNGEPLLSKDIYPAIQWATDNKVSTMIASNGVLMNERNNEKLLKAGLDCIKVHISGFTQPVHSIEHRRGNVELIKKNITHLARLNREGGYGMIILLDYIYYEHNKHELELARKFADDLGIMFNIRKGYPKGLEHLEPAGAPEPNMKDVICDWLWTVLTVDWNGSIYPCCDCVTFSNVESFAVYKPGETNILEAWNGPRIRGMRNTHITQGRDPIPVCKDCTRVGVMFKR